MKHQPKDKSQAVSKKGKVLHISHEQIEQRGCVEICSFLKPHSLILGCKG